MTALATHAHAEPRTTTLVFGPLEKPLSTEQHALLSRAIAKAIGQGYAVARLETDTHVTVTAVITAPITQPLTRVRELVPGAVVTALVGEATAHEE